MGGGLFSFRGARVRELGREAGGCRCNRVLWFCPDSLFHPLFVSLGRDGKNIHFRSSILVNITVFGIIYFSGYYDVRDSTGRCNFDREYANVPAGVRVNCLTNTISETLLPSTVAATMVCCTVHQ